MTRNSVRHGQRRPTSSELARFIELIAKETQNQVDGRGGYR